MTVRFLLLTASMAAVAAFGQRTKKSSTVTFRFQPVGLGVTETASVNLYNSASQSTSGTAGSCTGSVIFLNANGTAIGAASTFTVKAGEVTAVTLPFASSGASGMRTLMIPTVTHTRTSGNLCLLDISLAIYDTSSGVTHAVVSVGH